MTADLLDPLDLLGALVAARSPNPQGDERAAAGVVREAPARSGCRSPRSTAGRRSVLTS